jgi:dephospho-CoA kinase
MKLIGLTGTTGSGKGYVSAYFARAGINSIDTDAIVHRLYRDDEECIGALEQAFGEIRAEDGSVDRKRLASIVFADREKLATLNSIVHKYVAREVERICHAKEREGCDLLLLDAPQLYEAGMERICYRVIAVTAPQSVRKARICARDHLDAEAADKRIGNQHSDAFFEAKADYVIHNDGQASVSKQVERIIGELKNG